MDRQDLRKLFEAILASTNVYFQPPESKKLSFPAIVYSRKSIDNTHADNGIYKQDTMYKVVVIDPDPDSIIVQRVSCLPMCRHVNHYTANNLNYDVFDLYF